MKNIFIPLILLIIILGKANSAEYYNNRVVVKFKDFKNIDKFEKELSNYIHNYKINPYISANSLRMLEKKLNYSNQLLSTQPIKDYQIFKIFKIDYQDNIDPQLLSTKLKKSKFIQYIEPEYKRQIDVELPNDTLLSQQYALFNCQVFEALQTLKDIKDSVLIGEVDTGLDYLHEDLQNIMWVNPGEDGIDDNGNDKRNNGIDDDHNGYIDDWKGWDFGSSDSLGQDNDPYPGGGHGTHVAGIIAANTNNNIGIAGINPFAKILPVKIGYDDPNIRNLIRSYEGLLYAAMMGADVINCSWGGGGYSAAENDIVQQANAFGALIVAAAGNNSQNTKFYPASYDNVISVAATDQTDRKSYFSNYHYVVSVSAPGTMVLSTTPNNNYEAWNGTSMASPVAAAIAGLIKIKHPEYNNQMIGEHLKATCDNIDSLNPDFIGLIGRGRVNAYKAMTDTNLYSLNIKDIEIIKSTPNSVLIQGDTVRIKFAFQNTLKPLTNVTLQATSQLIDSTYFINNQLDLGNFATMQSKSPENSIQFVIPQINGIDITVPINIYITSNENFKIQTQVSILINPSYRTIDKNNISLTIGSIGNIAFNDYPTNNQGDGFVWKGGSNLLFEGAIMVGVDTVRVSDIARGANPSYRSYDFHIIDPIVVHSPGIDVTLETASKFEDNIDSNTVGVNVANYFYQFDTETMEDCIVARYDATNITNSKFDSLFLGNYYDWDIGVSGSNDFTYWDYQNQLAICYNPESDSLPYIGTMLVSNQKVNYFAIDNDGTTDDNPGVYDGFTKLEKWKMLSSGIGRDSSGIKDISNVISAGPIELESGKTEKIVFVIFLADNLDQLITKSKAIRKFMKSPSSVSDYLDPINNTNIIKSIYPNPANANNINLLIDNPYNKPTNIRLFDINGQLVKQYTNYNNNNIKLDITNIVNGAYIIQISLGNIKQYKKVIIQK